MKKKTFVVGETVISPGTKVSIPGVTCGYVTRIEGKKIRVCALEKKPTNEQLKEWQGFFAPGQLFKHSQLVVVPEITIQKPRVSGQSELKFTQDQMSKAFDMVKNKNGWKLPIRAIFANPGEKNMRCLQEAVVHFTGGDCQISYLSKGIVRVTASGYYNNIGA